MIYTIGHKVNYLKAIAESDDGKIQKIGKCPPSPNNPEWMRKQYPDGYPGGYAFLTIEDAERRIVEDGQVGNWAVFGLDADWERDTEPAKEGWWHSLLRDADIIVLDESAPTTIDEIEF